MGALQGRRVCLVGSGRRTAVLVFAVLAGEPLAGCGGDAGDPASPRATTATSPASEIFSTTPPERAAAAEGLAYLALGDSLSRGVEPEPSLTLRRGYPRQLAASLNRRTGEPVALVEAGCGGATTASFIDGGKGCPPDAPVPYANTAPETSQLAWAADWLRSRGDRPTLVTLSLGANDVLACANADAAAIRSCFSAGAKPYAARIETIVRQLSAAAGRQTVFAGMTLYDPVLGAARLGKASLQTAAAFHEGVARVVNPFLRDRLGRAGWEVADLGAAVHEDVPLTSKSSRAIDDICQYSWACTPPGDIHLNGSGYALAAELHEREILRPLRKVYPPLRR